MHEKAYGGHPHYQRVEAFRHLPVQVQVLVPSVSTRTAKTPSEPRDVAGPRGDPSG